jgi:hypothetical protein
MQQAEYASLFEDAMEGYTARCSVYSKIALHDYIMEENMDVSGDTVITCRQTGNIIHGEERENLVSMSTFMKLGTLGVFRGSTWVEEAKAVWHASKLV